MSAAEFQALLESPEGSQVEFKSASGGFDFENLAKYCVALANEGGGTIVLGVTDERPRRVIGTRAFKEPGRTEAGLYEKLGHRIRVTQYNLESTRVNAGWTGKPTKRCCSSMSVIQAQRGLSLRNSPKYYPSFRADRFKDCYRNSDARVSSY